MSALLFIAASCLFANLLALSITKKQKQLRHRIEIFTFDLVADPGTPLFLETIT